MVFLREHRPQLAERLAQADTSDPPGSDSRLREAWRKSAPWIRLREEDPEAFQRQFAEFSRANDAERQADQLWRAMESGADAATIARLKGELSKSIESAMDARRENQKRELEEMTARLERVRASMDEQEKGREAFVLKQMDRLLETAKNRRGRDGGDRPKPPRGG
ncbi:MAG: hypothetical protein JNM07_05515 [Phycisphaerae bacterium]|nr:hypothetical protein [Phycisphaerae bacterium]